jgi:hypothetical protein
MRIADESDSYQCAVNPALRRLVDDKVDEAVAATFTSQ